MLWRLLIGCFVFARATGTCLPLLAARPDPWCFLSLRGPSDLQPGNQLPISSSSTTRIAAEGYQVYTPSGPKPHEHPRAGEVHCKRILRSQLGYLGLAPMAGEETK